MTSHEQPSTGRERVDGISDQIADNLSNLAFKTDDATPGPLQLPYGNPGVEYLALEHR